MTSQVPAHILELLSKAGGPKPKPDLYVASAEGGYSAKPPASSAETTSSSRE